VNGQEYRVDYLPAESNTGMFGGNSNWRGPIWFPVNALIYRALLNYYLYYGDGFKVECPTGSGHWLNLYEVADELGRRLTRIFLPDEANAGSSNPTPTGATISCSMNTSMAITGPAWAPVTRPAGPGWWAS
jgi:hypothetical protein